MAAVFQYSSTVARMRLSLATHHFGDKLCSGMAPRVRDWGGEGVGVKTNLTN